MPTRQTPALETKVGITRLMMPRDHPRLQQTSHELLLPDSLIAIQNDIPDSQQASFLTSSILDIITQDLADLNNRSPDEVVTRKFKYFRQREKKLVPSH
jgi:hypothetical protein